MIAEGDFMAVLEAHCLIRGVRVVPRGHIRADTRLLYPDGSAVSVFVEQGELTKSHGYAISDFGRTFAKLDEYGVSPFRGNRLKAIVETAKDLGVQVIQDRLVLELGEIEDLEIGLINLAQACVRASCMIFGRRSSQRSLIEDDIDEVVRSTGLAFQSPYKFKGPYQKIVQVDLRSFQPGKIFGHYNTL